jgi:hypothetical protein
MKTKLTTVIAVAVLASASFGFGATGAAPKATTTVEFIEPENYTDFKTSWSGFDADRESLEASLIARIEREVARSLPAGYHLAVKFRDIDMAGDFEPWRSVHFSDVRILRSSTPPRMFFDYALTDARGEIVASGERRLIDMTYDMRLRPFFREELDIEGELMGDFISRLARDVRRPAT